MDHKSVQFVCASVCQTITFEWYSTFDIDICNLVYHDSKSGCEVKVTGGLMAITRSQLIEKWNWSPQKTCSGSVAEKQMWTEKHMYTGWPHMHTETMEHNTLHYYLCSHDFIYVYLRFHVCCSFADRIRVIYSFADIVHSLWCHSGCVININEHVYIWWLHCKLTKGEMYKNDKWI